MSMRNMLPVLLGNMIANPGQFEEDFIRFLEKAGFDCSTVGKTIGKMSLYHFKSVAALNSINFFSGNYVQRETNVPGNSFVRPLGEHFVIYAIKVEEATAATFDLADWVPGASSVFAKNANLTIKINGTDRTTKIPLSEAMEDLTTADNGIIILDEPFIWGGQVELVANIATQDPLPVGAANTWIRLTFQGIGLFS